MVVFDSDSDSGEAVPRSVRDGATQGGTGSEANRDPVGDDLYHAVPVGIGDHEIRGNPNLAGLRDPCVVMSQCDRGQGGLRGEPGGCSDRGGEDQEVSNHD